MVIYEHSFDGGKFLSANVELLRRGPTGLRLLELQMSLASSRVEEEEDWVWEGLSQWSIDPTAQ